MLQVLGELILGFELRDQGPFRECANAIARYRRYNRGVTARQSGSGEPLLPGSKAHNPEDLATLDSQVPTMTKAEPYRRMKGKMS